MLDLFAIAVFVILCGLLATWFLRYRRHPWDRYYPKIAWLRGGIYFCCCYLISYGSGAMRLLAESPIATSGQLADPGWRWFTAGLYAFIFIAYSGVWAYFTPVFERRSNRFMSGLFGFLWGSSSGQLFLAVWLLIGRLGMPEWGTWIATFLILGAWQPNWHSIYWDHYIAPEHDTPMTQKIKALGCHIPNLVIGLTHLTLYDNYFIFVSAQIIACVSAGLGMRYPAPWVAPSAMDYAARSTARIPRCTGYIPEDPLTDPYTPFYPGWRGQRRAPFPRPNRS
ncbi:MAG: hypothetical protein KJ041_07935 [Gammaproteobacteria bacterium]|nr:hypothetical protein [Gammaproteobacteria bacterium]